MAERLVLTQAHNGQCISFDSERRHIWSGRLAPKANTCCHKNIEHAALRAPSLVFIIFLHCGTANMFGGQA